LRARGSRIADGNTLAADEVVSGSFRNIAGTVTSIDAANGTITVNDLATKKPVVVKVTATSQLKKLPQPMAQRIAARLKGNSGEASAAGTGGAQTEAGHPGASSASGARAATAPAGQGSAGAADSAAAGERGARRGEPGSPAGASSSGAAGERQGNSGDLQQSIARMPAATLADLEKGDAVMIVATSDSATASTTAITLLAGVEPILQASPNGGQSILTPWSLSGAPSGDAATQ
jgi:hypothetical protein